MKKYIIPKDIKVKEVVAYGLSGKQIIYLAFGIGGALGAFTLPVPLDLRIALAILSTASSLLVSLAKRHGQELDKYVWNSAKYMIRNKEWNINDMEKEEAPIVIRYHSRQPSSA